MSLLGSMTTAISGLTAQSRALGHVSDNVANSQTVGFKRVDTNFTSWLTRTNLRLHMPGSVEARPDYTNTIQGTVEQVENPLAMAIAGQGFFSVAQARGGQGDSVIFDDRQFFTRAGDFAMDRDGYMVNGAGYYLEGWEIQQNGEPDRTTLGPIRISELVYNPQPTSTIDLAANLPANVATVTTVPGAAPWAPAEDPVSSVIQIFDDLGNQQQVTLDWWRLDVDTWRLRITPDGDTLNPVDGYFADIDFGGQIAAGPPAVDAPAGTISSITPLSATTGTTPAPLAAGDAAFLGFTVDYGFGNQAIQLGLGGFGIPTGLTSYSGTEYTVRDLSQDGVPLGSYSGVTVRENGDVAVNYDNGQTRIVARVPVVAFNDPDKLQRLDGQAFMRTVESGEARVTDAATNGVGKLVTGSIERSNVDIASEFSKLILAQRAYTSNTRIVTAADEMLQDTINMKR
ncbi:flagellar hook protein FlgE [Falsiroseomonas tokyonensis]|uniref:Flagellar hook protein FlgE n=1 Tax=Falsiroseomonas tokyonensis TaxID=430521 RepID=A0ABV7C289_9PROT|nr:flagellar hook-basal body complex protein [Falsiroseomonas tokyonensis]MBU8540777.1 flagellar hook-basal body complex protein [Falsiroseomonas tokyonensis]